LLAAAKRAGEDAARQVGEQLRRQAELLPAKERRKHEREGGEALRRSERRARAATLDLVLRLAELWLRDVWCVAIGAGDLVLAVDRREAIEADAHAIARLDDEGRAPAALRRAVELVAETRLRLPLNVSEELAVEALAYGLKEAIGPAIGPRLG
jgi:DNA polymerase-3 subunit delta'